MKPGLSDTELVRLHDLLVQRATEGLDVHGQGELDRLDPDGEAGDDFDLAAAAIDLATLVVEPMPAHVAARFAAKQNPVIATSTAPAVPAVAAVLPERPERVTAPAPTRAIATAPRARLRRLALPFAAAAAAVLAFGAGRWQADQRSSATSATSANDQPGRAALLADPSTWHRALRSAAADGHAAGDVVWDPAHQRGYLRVAGIPPNAAAVARYQLWIVDRGRDERYPVDGGLFDVATEGETVVTFQAKLPVADPIRMLVTLEAPDGAVVSTRARTILVSD